MPLWVLSVEALGGVLLLDGTSDEAIALFGSSRSGNATQPDGVTAIERRLASLEVDVLTSLVTEDKVAVVVDGKSCPLSVLNHGLGTSGVLNDALTHAGPIDEELLRRVGSVEVKAAVAELEGSVVVGFWAARSVLSASVDQERVLGSLEGTVLKVASGADGLDCENIAILDLGIGGKSSDEAGGGSGNGSGGELHFGWSVGVEEVEVKVVSWLVDVVLMFECV
jgi:hypothetical protein